MTVGEYIKNLRESKKYSQRKLALVANLSNTTISRIESGMVTPDTDSLAKIATALNEPIQNLINLQQDSSNTLSKKEKKDIAKDLEKFKKELLESDELMFDGHPMSEESLNNILSAIEIGMEQVRRKNKIKYNPKKFKNNEE